ncbi:MAG: SDR family oxidoreductase [Acidobacteriota bacterium]|nr:SDR family oxidoreductase [Acidobacteriota bacterium]
MAKKLTAKTSTKSPMPAPPSAGAEKPRKPRGGRFVLSGGPALQGQVAVVTGGSKGIGLAISEALAAEGCKVILFGRDRAALRHATTVLSKYGNPVLPVEGDVTEEISVISLFEEVRRRFGRVDILVNNAGIAPGASIAETHLDVWRKTIDTNLTGTFLCARAALPLMKAGGTIVNNLSIMAEVVFPNMAAYAASKHGALGFTKALRLEVKDRGIRVIALVPGAVDTDIWDQFFPDAPREKMLAPETVAAMLITALRLPADSTAEEIRIMPTSGVL